MSEPLAALLPGESPDVLGLDAQRTLERIKGERAAAEAAAAAELRAVAHWADLHRTGGTVGAVDPVTEQMLGLAPGAVAGSVQSHSLLGREGDLRLLGEGAFTVEEFAITELAAALRMSESAARSYVGQALELRERLPRLWAQVQAGVVAVWAARRVAEETIPLNEATAARVDRLVARYAGQVSVRRILRAVSAAVQRHDPAMARARTEAAAERRGVWVEVDGPELTGTGTGTISAVTSSVDAAAFAAAVGRVATELERLGDTDAEQVRRSKAVGVLADPQHALDLHATADAAVAEAESRKAAGAGEGARVDRRPTRRPHGGAAGAHDRPTIHLHLHLDAVQAREGVARTPYGPQPLVAVESWLRDLAPGASIKVTPVVDLAEQISVDAYEAPDRLRDQVDHRDPTCMFPWCGRRGRFDLDHVVEYVPLDEGGPPDQTNSQNLQKLCRFHHRVKTHGDWDVVRQAGGWLMWTSPLGERYAVDMEGTCALERLPAPA